MFSTQLYNKNVKCNRKPLILYTINFPQRIEFSYLEADLFMQDSFRRAHFGGAK